MQGGDLGTLLKDRPISLLGRDKLVPRIDEMQRKAELLPPHDLGY